jgi:hypothetical protein
MASNLKKTAEHMFSIQLNSKDHLKSIVLPNDESGNILIEGFLGELENVNFTEGIMLEINGANGSLKMDLSENELKELTKNFSTKNKMKK